MNRESKRKRLFRNHALSKSTIFSSKERIRAQNLFLSLHDRERSALYNNRFTFRSTQWRLKNLASKFVIDAIEPGDEGGLSEANFLHPRIRARSRILEILCADSVLITLTDAGLCRAFDCTTHRSLDVLNTHRNEIVRSTFYNRHDHSIITVSVNRDDPMNRLICHVVGIVHIRAGRVRQESFQILQSEQLSFPGFVEFDDVNGKIVSYCARSRKYRIWSMSNYEMVFEIDGHDIQEVKIGSCGHLLTIHHRVQKIIAGMASMCEMFVPMTVMDIHTGRVIRSLAIKVGIAQLHCARDSGTSTAEQDDGNRESSDESDIHPIEFAELLNEKLLLKQWGHRLRVFDIQRDRTGSKVKVVRGFKIPEAFVFLFNSNINLTFLRQGPELWHRDGHFIARLERQHLFDHCDMNMMHISKNQCVLFTIGHHSEASITERSIAAHARRRAAVRVSCTLTGELLWESEGEHLASACALSYNEQRSELYVGFGDGNVAVWTN